MRRLLLLITLWLMPYYVFSDSSLYITNGDVNFRNDSSIDSQVIQILSKGDKVSLISNINGWAYIKLADGSKGYVSSEFLDLYNEDEKSSSIGFWIVAFVIALAIGWFKSPSRCSICGTPFKRKKYKWKINKKTKFLCPNCNRSLERKESNRRFKEQFN